MNPALALSFLTPMTPATPAPVAHMLVDCMDAQCDVLVLDAGSSLDADDYTWSVDGNVISNDEVTEWPITSDQHLIELDVSGPGGSDSQSRFMVQGTPSNHPVEPGVPVPLVVAGVTSCNSGHLIVSTIGGCFTGAKTVSHDVDGNGALSKFMYNRTSNAVGRMGNAAGAVSYENSFSGIAYHGLVNPGLHVAGKTYPPTVHTTSENVTSYLPMVVNKTYNITTGYVASLNNQGVTGKTIKVTCPSSSSAPSYAVQ